MVHIIEENLLDEEAFLDCTVVELYREYLKRWSRLLKYDSNFFLVHKHINMYVYGRQH